MGLCKARHEELWANRNANYKVFHMAREKSNTVTTKKTKAKIFKK